MRVSRGFTLIEILVVIVVIALLVSITALNSDSDPREDLLKNEASKVKFFLENLTDEAILNSKNIAAHLTVAGIGVYSWEKKINPEKDDESSSSENEKDQWAWASYQSRNVEPLSLENDIEFKLSINESEVFLQSSIEKEKDINPQIIIQSSGIQTISQIKLVIDDYDRHIKIQSNGAGRYKVGDLTDAL